MKIHKKGRPEPEELDRILRAYKSGVLLKDLARRFNRSKTVIAEIIRNSGALNNEQGGIVVGGVIRSGAPD